MRLTFVNKYRFLLALIPASAIALAALGVTQAQQPHVLLLEVKGTINPVTEGFIAKGVMRAEKQDASIIIIRLDTNGGLLDSTKKITQHLLNTKVPSVVYVAPSGARAASAGTFITAAATFAVMAPGTTIGAATPVAMHGDELSETIKSKATNSAAAEMRSIAELRGRNPQPLEDTVLRAMSFTDKEAVQSGIVNFISDDVNYILARLDGSEVKASGPEEPILILDIYGAEIQTMEMSLIEKLLQTLSDPNIAFILLSIGSLGILVEILAPGQIVPGVTGAILAILALVLLGNLPVNWGAVTLIVLAVVLAVMELYVGGFGALGAGAIGSFILGAALLFFHTGPPSPTMPHTGVNLWVLMATTVTLSASGAWVLVTVIRSRRGPPEPGMASLLGKIADVATNIAPRGTVRLDNQLWTAMAHGHDHIAAGDKVEVVDVDEVTLIVSRLSSADYPSIE
ncbi:nodulation protein NfeD [Dehalococcoidia bacterium]|nr:nodulation protein NfeD [Dehalococcoidia bacterium]